MTGLNRQRPPLSVLLYLLGRQRLVVWRTPDEFAVLRPPEATALSGDRHVRHVRWMRRLDRWWDPLVVWLPPLLALLLAVLLAFVPTLRLPTLVIAITVLLYATATMLLALLYGLLQFCRRLAGSTPRHRQASKQIIVQNWSIALCHVTDSRKTSNMLELALEHVATEARKTSDPATTFVCDLRVITTSATQAAAQDDTLVTRVPGTDLLIIRRPGDSSMPRSDINLDLTDPAGFVALFLLTVAVIIASLAESVARWERAACGTQCAGRPTSYRDSLYWVLSQLAFRGDPDGLSPATAYAQSIGLLLIPLGVTILGVFIAAGVQSARIHKKTFREFKQNMTQLLDEADRTTWGNVFISYRQGREKQAVVGLHQLLTTRFGPDKVFMDIRSISPGTPYPDELRAKLDTSTVLLAVIQQDWLDTLQKRRIATDLDWVRYEISTALQAGKTVIPVLLDDAPLPVAADLPDDLASLASRQACPLRWTSLDEDLARLVAAIEPRLQVR